MRKIESLLVLLLLALGISGTRAEVVSPYTFGFDSGFQEEYDDLAGNLNIGFGWGHIADGFMEELAIYDYVYPEYSFKATEGVDGSGCIWAGNQDLVGYQYNYSEEYCGSTTDLIVTPKISGASSIQVKDYESGKVKFYKVTKEGDSYVRGDEISVTVPTLSTSDWTTVSITDAGYEGYVGIYASNVYIDDFKAESAETEGGTVVENRKLTITSASLVGSSKIDCNADGSATINVKVSLTNSGNVDLNPGDENFSLSLVSSDKLTTYATYNIENAIAQGTTEEIEVAFNIPNAASYTSYISMYLQENVSSNSKWVASPTFIAYKPILKVLDEEEKEVEDKTAVDFGTTTEGGSKAFTIQNNGAAPMNIAEVVVPEGFTTDLTAPVTIEAHGQKAFTVAIDTKTNGRKAGDLTLKFKEEDGLADFTLSLSGTIIDPNKYYLDFNDNLMPAGTITTGGWTPKKYYLGGDETLDALQQTTKEKQKFITPLLKVAKDETMSFETGIQGRFIEKDFALNVYYSSDRQNWTLAKAITSADVPDKMINSSQAIYELKSFTINEIPEGNWYVAFEGAYANLDNIYGFEAVDVAHDWMLSDLSLPETGMVNNKYTATVTLKNINSNKEEAEGYEAKLYFDGKEAAKAEAVEVEAGDSASYTFSFTPHETGTYEAYIEFSDGGYKATSSVVNVTVKTETAQREAQAGEATGASSDVPVALNYQYSETETVYTADQMKGLKKGDKISSITYRGYYANEEDYTTHLNVWIGNTTEALDTENKPTKADIDEKVKSMYSAFDGDYTFTKTGSSDEDMGDLVVIKLAEPFVYDGENLRIVVRASNEIERTPVFKMRFESDSNDKTHTYFRRTTTAESFENEAAWLWEQPIAHFTLVQEPSTLKGKVTSNGKPVEGAKITIKHEDVLYTAETEADGTYSINVIQSSLAYDLTAEAEGHETFVASEPIEFVPGEDLTFDIKFDTSAIESTEASMTDANATVYTLAGQPVCKAANLKSLKPGIYIVNGKKTVIK